MKRIFTMEMYNPEIKQYFLDGYSESSQIAFERVLRRASVVETELGKDLYDFGRDEIKQVLQLMNPNKVTTSKTNGDVLRTYVNWAIEKGYRSNTINPMVGISSDWYEQFVDRSKRTVFHKDEIDKMINYLKNEQDQAVVIGLFEGIRPDELLGIKPEQDIDQESGMITLMNKKGEVRIGQFTDRLISIFMRAYRQERYLKSNGSTKETLRALSEAPLIDTGYLIKLSGTSNKKNSIPDNTLFYRKMKIIQNYSEEFKYFNPVNIRNSGMLYRAYQLFLRDGELSTQQLNEVCEEYDVPKIITTTKKGKQTIAYKRSQLVLEFLNIETLKEVYPDI